MGHGVYRKFESAFTLTSGSTLSSDFVLDRAYKNVYLEVPTMASGSLFVQVALTATDTYRRVTEPIPNQDTDFAIDSASTQRLVQIPGGFQAYKLESSSGATDTTTVFNVICSDL